MMILGLHHFAVIASSEVSIAYYERLGFKKVLLIERAQDIVVLLEGYGIELELFIDSNHPPRAQMPENMGLRHLALKVESCLEMTELFFCGPIMIDWIGRKYCFTEDPDGLPIEFHE